MSHYNSSSHRLTNFASSNEQSSSSNIDGAQSNQSTNVAESNLLPTAQEFYPSNTTGNQGVIKKKPQGQGSRWNARNPRYSSGRTFNSNNNYNEYSSNRGSSNNYERTRGPRYFGNNFLENSEDSSFDVDGSSDRPDTSNSYRAEYESSNYSYGQYKKNSNYRKKRDTTANVSLQQYDYDNRYNGSKATSNRSYSNNYYNKYSNSKHKQGNGENSRENYFDQDNFSYNDNISNYGTADYYSKNENKYEGNWRNDEKSGRKCKTSADNSPKNVSTAGQRERLIDMINRRVLECLVCCEKIRNIDRVWSCSQCYHIIHLNCIIAWAKSSKVDNNWRCPACQNGCSQVPTEYKCYCGKQASPKFDPSIIAHGCGDMCLKKGRNCEHKCSILCHPGPCPDCNIMVPKPCGCGATRQVVKCSTDVEIVCDALCDKTLNCGLHKCPKKCHMGPCASCDLVIIQECFCGKTGRKVPCTAEFNGATQFRCDNPCQALLSCGNHKCQKQCHSGPCSPCERGLDQIRSCFCGKTPLESQRMSCLDPVPSCDKTCGKTLHCGQPNSPHACGARCHEGKCPPCPLTTTVRCRCGHMDKEIACQKLTTKADDARCEKKCTKKRLCGKHKCNQKCCIEVEHVCPLPCNHQLSCGLHRCELTCHSGRCPACLETSFEELYCECGSSVLYPPVPCGTKPPPCKKPCSRARSCGHPPNHECHSGPCPPCFVLSKRWCYGRHEQRAAIPCHQENFSCGLACNKAMSCGRHRCVKPCHEGGCPSPCAQPCTAPRMFCGHPCGKPCHDPPCPESSCKHAVPITCPCGLQKGSRPCMDLVEEFRNIEMSQLKEKMNDMSLDQTVDISDIVGRPKRPSVLKILECNDECRILDRNRRLAIGLQIRNPDLSQKLTPRYSDFMKQWAKKDPNFCQRIHDKLTELVQLSKQSKQKSRSHSFDSMNRDKRHFIHEYCEHFGVESAAYDTEPNRNVVATAIKDKSWLPSMSLLEAIQRENGQRRVPGPVLGSSSSGKPETVSLRLLTRTQNQ